MKKNRGDSYLKTYSAVMTVLVLLLLSGMSKSSEAKKADFEALQQRTINLERIGMAYEKLYQDAKEVTGNEIRTTHGAIALAFGDKYNEAIKVAKCESGLNPKAKNKQSSATGLFQVLSQTHQVNQAFLKDPLINALVARKLYDASGWKPWLASVKCHNLY